ncbi:hypothetical protein F4779DRAFT_288025 [Xylariaceae sp. FL0662B]|nr:hypothetical protein F4779DRAFT_288025 [Xylariaceae sp. FL0662B]
MDSNCLSNDSDQASLNRQHFAGRVDPSFEASPNDTLSAGLNFLPVELVLEIMQLLSHTELSNLALVSKQMLRIFNGSRHILIATCLGRQPEFEALLLLHMFDKLKLKPEAITHPRNVYYDYDLARGIKTPLVEREPLQLKRRTVSPQAAILNKSDMVAIRNSVKIIDWWVEVYPRLRWRDDESSNRRCLRPAEEVRLRKAIACFWFYSSRHHGIRNRTFTQPKLWSNDPRLYHLRSLSTNELFELYDLWDTLYHTISRDLCSSIKQVDEDPVPWGLEEGRHPWIVKTYLKLDPQRLRSFLLRYPIGSKRTSIVAAVSQEMCSSFCRDIETLEMSILTILEERGLSGGSNDLSVGIIDEDRTQKLACFDNDGSPSGCPTTGPRGWGRQVNMGVPHGDDGRDFTC